jgi:hypothetical protein
MVIAVQLNPSAGAHLQRHGPPDEVAAEPEGARVVGSQGLYEDQVVRGGSADQGRGAGAVSGRQGACRGAKRMVHTHTVESVLKENV